MAKRKIVCVIIGLSLAILAIFLSKTYRPYILHHRIYDYHFADTIGNIFAVPSALFFISGLLRKKTKIYYSIPAVIVGFIIYELMSLVGLNGTFDIFDVIATIFSGTITYLTLYYVFNVREL